MLDKLLWREEITNWGEYNTPNHIYITEGTNLVGYVPFGTDVPHIFKKPMKTWAVTRRKFRTLTKKEVRAYLENLV